MLASAHECASIYLLQSNFPSCLLPVPRALAVTINKARGQMPQCVGVSLPCNISHGQLYDTASTVGAPDQSPSWCPTGMWAAWRARTL